MACVENVNYVININGIPSSYFLAERGLRQGCPLAHLLFILAMNTLSLHINKAVNEHRCRPIKISRYISISHNLFVDDVLLCAMLCQDSWNCLFDILVNFQKSTGLNINKSKSTLYHNGTNLNLVNRIAAMFGIVTCLLQDGIKYLGFHLKANGYKAKDWEWLIKRYYKKISSWEYRTLSLAGRVILTSAILSQMFVYWAHLFYLPTCTIQLMNKVTTNFIWGGMSEQRKYHLVKMDAISIPKQHGGWGLKDLRLSGRALLCRSLWRGIFGEGPWSNIIRLKYMKGKNLEFWYRVGSIGTRQGSAIWYSLRKIEQYFIMRLKWRIFTGNSILIGGIWKSITEHLYQCGFHRHGNADQLIWSVSNARRPVRVRDIYLDMILSKIPPSRESFPVVFWKAGCPLKYIHFAWLVFHNKNLTWDNLRKRCRHGPSRSSMCEADEETNFHMFFQCPSIQQIWYVMENTYVFPLTIFDSSHAAFIWWSRQRAPRRYLILIFLWTSWKWRSSKISNDSRAPLMSILDNTIATWTSVYGSIDI
eukprot:PITA_36565